jgi:hypothetical protein
VVNEDIIKLNYSRKPICIRACGLKLLTLDHQPLAHTVATIDGKWIIISKNSL